MTQNFRPAFSYNVLTPAYDVLCELGGFGASLKRKIVELAHIKPGEKVLDIGAGTGTFMLEATKKEPKANIVGVDPDQKILSIAKRKLESVNRIKLIKGYAQDLPFQDESFDLAVSILTFHHLKTEDKRKAAKEIYRVLKKSGKFLLADFGKAVGPVSYILLNLGSIFDGGEQMRANIRGELPILLNGVGFRVKKVGKRYRGMEFLLVRK